MKAVTFFNFSFFGGWREGNVVDGHVRILFDIPNNRFAVHKFGDYGGLQWYKDVDMYLELSENSYRYVHDIAVGYKKAIELGYETRLSETSEEIRNIEIDKIKWYEFKNSYISKNIMRGDICRESRTGREFKVEGFHDLMAINRDYNYVIISRDVPHVERASIQQLSDAYDKYGSPFEGKYGHPWEKVSEIPKDFYLATVFKFDNVQYENYVHPSRDREYWKDLVGNIYSMNCTLGMYKSHVIDTLGRFVCCLNDVRYYLRKVEENVVKGLKWETDRQVFIEKLNTAFEINTRLTYLNF